MHHLCERMTKLCEKLHSSAKTSLGIEQTKEVAMLPRGLSFRPIRWHFTIIASNRMFWLKENLMPFQKIPGLMMIFSLFLLKCYVKSPLKYWKGCIVYNVRENGVLPYTNGKISISSFLSCRLKHCSNYRKYPRPRKKLPIVFFAVTKSASLWRNAFTILWLIVVFFFVFFFIHANARAHARCLLRQGVTWLPVPSYSPDKMSVLWLVHLVPF